MLKNIDQIKSIPLDGVVGQYVKLKSSGTDWKGLCPFHNEKSPSFVVNRKGNFYKCFGCGKSGDVINFYESIENLTFRQAVKRLGEIYSIDVSDDGDNIIPVPDGQVLKWFYERGISEKTVRAFRVHFVKTFFSQQTPSAEAIAFPFIQRGMVFNTKFRLFDKKDFRLTPQAKVGFYNLDSVHGHEVYIVEGEIDAMSLYEAGIKSVVSVPNGSSSIAYVNDYEQYFKNRTVFLAGDNDPAGLKQIQALKTHFGDQAVIIGWPEGVKDANEYLLKYSAMELAAFIRARSIKPTFNAAVSEALEESMAPTFPMEIFSSDVQASFKGISQEKSIPLDLLCAAALFSITALSGKMYETSLNGDIKNILYMMLVAPSGVGKTPAYANVCGNIIKAYEDHHMEEYEAAMTNYNNLIRRKVQDLPPKPFFVPRMLKGGTAEGIMKYAQHAKAGFGIYFDEGGRMMGAPNAYKKDTGSNDFYNEIWNGDNFIDARASDENQRFVRATNISIMAGMQTPRLAQYFTVDSIDSGIAGRFLLCSSPRIPLNEEVNMFRREKRNACQSWQDKIIFLFNRGLIFGGFPHQIRFTPEAEVAYNALCKLRIRTSNVNALMGSKDGISALMGVYDSKLFAYQGRLLIPLALLANHEDPVITEEVVMQAERLINYFRNQAELLFKIVVNQHSTGLNENAQALFDLLPEQFTIAEADAIAASLKLSKVFFTVHFKRSYEPGGWIVKKGRGQYIKNN